MNNPESDVPGAAFKGINARDFLSFGVGHVAYIRPAVHQGHQGYAIFGADGTALAFQAEKNAAYMLLRENEMEPVTLQ